MLPPFIDGYDVSEAIWAPRAHDGRIADTQVAQVIEPGLIGIVREPRAAVAVEVHFQVLSPLIYGERRHELNLAGRSVLSYEKGSASELFAKLSLSIRLPLGQGTYDPRKIGFMLHKVYAGDI